MFVTVFVYREGEQINEIDSKWREVADEEGAIAQASMTLMEWARSTYPPADHDRWLKVTHGQQVF